MLTLASCRRGAPPATARPTTTPTPRSTPLPPLPTEVPLGSEDNPLHLQIVAPQTSRSQSSLDDAVSELEAALLDETDLAIAVDLVDTDAEALAALCSSSNGTVSAAWLSGLAALAADAQNCGSPALQVERGTRSSAASGDEALILVADDSEVASVGDLDEPTFCRLGYRDMYSWVIPVMLLRAGGITTDGLGDVQDFDDARQMIVAVSDGNCDAAGIAASAFADLPGAVRSLVRPLSTSVSIPFTVLMLPPELPLAQQQALTDALVSIGNGSRASTLDALLDEDQILEISSDDFTSLRSFFNRAGIDLAQLGN